MIIYKYEVEPSYEIQEIEMPIYSRPISIIEQDGKLIMYCRVNNKATGTDTYRYLLVGTGQDIGHVKMYSYEFIGTVKQGEFVWHLFWVKY